MSPKFRGGSDDWLDDEDSSDGRALNPRPKKEITARSVELPLQEANATVAEVFPNQCRVKMDSDQSDLLCNYRRAEVVAKSKTETRERTPVAVGDRVLVQSTGAESGVIEGICIRKNSLSRPAPGREGGKIFHVLAANLDILVIVASVKNPDFALGLVDRFLVSAEAEGIQVLLCMTKIDLVDLHSPKPWEIYRDLGYPLIEVSATQSLGVADLLKQIAGKTVAFCGQSGVGKTSLLRVLLGSDVGIVGHVNVKTGKGRHTTTGAVLLNGPASSRWIDTPGVKEFGLSQIPPSQLGTFFKEFEILPCSKKGCLHMDEPNCRAKELARYSSYRKIMTSLIEDETES